jgi:hypothetical protein
MTDYQASTALQRLERISNAHACQDRSKSFSYWLEAVARYTGFRKAGLLDIACDAANLMHTIFTAEGGNVDPLALKAIQDTNPSLDLSDLPSGDALLGIINVAKGRYFEYKVVERLNAGERVGDIILPNGFKAVLADSPSQPGWDVMIVDTEGLVSEYLQLKATDSIGYIRDALERYPGIKILATDEVAIRVFDEFEVLESGIGNEWLTQEINQGILDNESFMNSFLEAFSPVFSLAVIAGTEGFQILVNRKELRSSINDCKARAGKSLASQAIAAIVFSSGAELLAMPAGLFSRLLLERLHDLTLTSQIILRSRIEMVQLRLFQQDQSLLPRT